MIQTYRTGYRVNRQYGRIFTLHHLGNADP